ncbi:MAG: LppX_LprAFG lipoprotein [Anaerolineae bacterium]|nr:LppX_LprAFG lipoprotein [Anaerolineae bacterium]
MLRLLLIALVVLVVGCSSAPATETPPDPINLITEAATNIRTAKTFRISVDETGPDYILYTDYAAVFFRRAVAQYVAPGMMQATIRVLAAGLPIQVDVFSRGAEQWYRAIWTGNQWLNQPFAPDFNPETLLAEETGFQAALDALIDLKYVGGTQLENGADVHHITASAAGPKVAALFGNLIEPTGKVDVDVFIDQMTLFPARFIITEFDSLFTVTPEPGETADPVEWTIDVYDIDAPAEISPPAAAGVTPETTAPADENLLAPIDSVTPEATAS